MSNLQLFEFNSQSVRVISVNGDPWFVGNDVLSAIKSTTTVTAAKTVIDSDLGKEFVNSHPLETSGGVQDFTIFAEAAVTFLVSRSRTKTGKAFNRLLHAEILPTIRKTGKYEVVPTQPAIPQTYAEALRSLADEVEQKQKLIEANQALQVEVEILEPKAERYDLAMSTDGWMTGEEIVKQLNAPNLSSPRKLYDILRAEKVLFKRPDGSNCPYADWSKNGLAALRNGKCFDGRMRFSPVFSYKGLDRIIDILRKHGITPRDKQFQFNFDSNKALEMKRA